MEIECRNDEENEKQIDFMWITNKKVIIGVCWSVLLLESNC